MDINTQNSSGMMNGMPPVAHENKKVGPIIGALIVVLILIITALFFFGQRLNTQAPLTTDTEVPIRNEAAASSAATSDDSTTLNAELDAQMRDVDYSF